jgi:hypothetical protein
MELTKGVEMELEPGFADQHRAKAEQGAGMAPESSQGRRGQPSWPAAAVVGS